jgi:hypothetical protein
MADTRQLYPQDYSLDSCKIITTLGQPYEFKPVLMYINYYEDLYSNYITGDLTINDSVGFLSTLSFSGNDYLILSFSKPGTDDKIEKTFRIYKVSNRYLTKDQNETYTLNFCSEEALLSEQYRISKSYMNVKVSDVVKDIVLNKLKVDAKKFSLNNLEETKNARNIVIPNYKGFEALNWLCTQAISKDSKTQGSSYLFFENILGFNFKSIQSMFKDPVYASYKYEPKNLTMPNDARVQDLPKEKTNVLTFDPVSNFDTLNTVNSGFFANQLIAIDTIRLQHKIHDFDYEKYFSGAQKLNPSGLLTSAQNRLGDTANKTYKSTLKVVTTNTGELIENEYIKSHDPTVKDILIETTVPYRTAQLAHINYIKYKLTIPGDPLMTVGRVIEFLLPEITRTSDGKDPDKFYSGKYLVTAVRHSIDFENKFLTIMEISKESLPNAYAQPDNSSSAWKSVRSK